MAKSPEQRGRMREELKDKTEARKIVETVVGVPSEDPDNEPSKAPEDSAFKAISDAVDKGDPVVSSSGSFVATPKPEKRGGPEVISKPEAELLARKFHGKTKEATLPLDETVEEVKGRNKELQRLKAERSQQPKKVIRQLRSLDPKGKKTCGFCACRVPVETMDSNKELCEVCAS
jgi:hypothetical protein